MVSTRCFWAEAPRWCRKSMPSARVRSLKGTAGSARRVSPAETGKYRAARATQNRRIVESGEGRGESGEWRVESVCIDALIIIFETKEKGKKSDPRRATKGLSNRDLRRPSIQFGCADSPLKGNRDESGPPGSAGVPPAPSPLGCRSVSLRWRTPPPCRRERQGPGPSRARASLPVDPGRGDGRGFASVVRAGRPRSRVGFLP